MTNALSLSALLYQASSGIVIPRLFRCVIAMPGVPEFGYNSDLEFCCDLVLYMVIYP
jgi:hypothetical protein